MLWLLALAAALAAGPAAAQVLTFTDSVYDTHNCVSPSGNSTTAAQLILNAWCWRSTARQMTR